MLFYIETEQLRMALKEIEIAESRGFNFCLATFRLDQYGKQLSDCKARFIDLCDRAHPTDDKLNWGRQGVSKRKKFENGKLISLVNPGYPEDRDEYDVNWDSGKYDRNKSKKALEAGKLVCSPNYYGVPNLWKEGKAYLGCVMRHCQVVEKLECESADEAIKWFESRCSATCGE